MPDRLQEVLNKVKWKLAFAPLPLGGAGGGPAAKEKSKKLYAGFQPAQDLPFWYRP
jgi:hypothetical protein